MAAEITGSGDSSSSSSYATTITWIAHTTGSHGTGLTFSDSNGDSASNNYDTVQFTHSLDSTNVIVDVIELTRPSGSYYNQQNAGMDIGHEQHVIAVRDGANTCKLIFYNANPANATYKILVQKVG